jgi:nucleoside-diphosphate-sugar epimerase
MANILACFNSSRDSQQNIYNIGVGEAISLNDLLAKVIDIAVAHGINYSIKPNYQDFIKGDIRHSCASIKLAQENLNYMPVNDFTTGLTNIFKWFSHDK